MAEPLFTADEVEARKAQLEHLETRRREKQIEWNEYWDQKGALEASQLVETVKHAQARAEEFLDALVMIVGSRGGFGLSFFDAFEQSDTNAVREKLAVYNIPEARRWLYILLRALGEVPRSWGRSAIVRFLRGNGKQKGAKYYGAGMFDSSYGWKAQEVDSISRWLIDTLYGKVLLVYVDAQQELREEDPDYELDVNRHAVTRFERDEEFISKLTGMLEARGLGPVPRPADEKPKKPRTPKLFKSGDTIRQRDVRDLPLPAHVRIPVKRLDDESKQWLDATIEHVVLRLIDGGYYQRALVVQGKAYATGSILEQTRKDWLDGATFLGPWTDEIVKKEVRPKFRYSRR